MESEQVNTPTAEGNSVPNPSTKAGENQEQYPLHENPRFKEVIGQKNDWKDKAMSAEKRISEYEAKDKAKEEKLLQDKGEFQTILDRKDAELKEALSKASEWGEYKSARRQAYLEELPEDKHEIFKALPYDKAEKFYQMETANSGVQNAGKTDSSRAGTTAKGDFGGYSSIEEWASKDPRGCEAHMAKNIAGYSWGNINNK